MESFRDTLGILSCNSIDSTQQNHEKEHYALYRPVLSRLKSIKTEKYEAKMNNIKANCLDQLVERTKETMPNKEALSTCAKDASGRGQGCVFMAYDVYNQECSRNHGIDRGNDSEFFMNKSANPQAPMTPLDRPKTKGRRETRRRSERTDGDRELSESPEQLLRRRARRFPKSSLLDNPDGPPVWSDTNSQEANEEGVFDAMADADASVMSLRDYRLALFRNNSELRDVPYSRLSNALSELQLQDEAVQCLYDDLSHAKQCLNETKLKLKKKKQKMKQQNASLLDVRAKLVTEKQCLHYKLQKESEANTMLKDKLTSLQSEVSRLRSHVQRTKSDLEETSSKLMEDCGNEETSKVSNLGLTISKENTSVIKSIKAQIADLEHHLEIERTQENRSVSSHYDRSGILRLQGYLEKAENQLHDVTTVQSKTMNEIREELSQSEEALRFASAREEVLSKELEDTIVESLQLDEKNGLHEKEFSIGTEFSSQQVHEKLRHCKKEADELKNEISRLSQKVAEETHRAQLEATQRIKDRQEFESKLMEKGKENRSFQDIITSLERRLAKAEEDAKLRTFSLEKEKEKDKEKQTSPQSIIESNYIVQGETQFRSELQALRCKLQRPSLGGSETLEKSPSPYSKLDHSQNRTPVMLTNITAAELQRELNGTGTKKVKDGGGNLEDKVGYLENQLQLAEKKIKQEHLRAEEEQRMAVETEAERLDEIARLKVELEMAKSSTATKIAVDYLASRRDISDSQFHQCDETASVRFDSEMDKPSRTIQTCATIDEIIEESPQLMNSSASGSSNDSSRSKTYSPEGSILPTDHKIPNSPLSPPQLRYVTSPPSNGTVLFNVAEEQDDLICTQDFNKSPRKTTNRQINIKNIQRRFSESADHFSATKTKFEQLKNPQDNRRDEQGMVAESPHTLARSVISNTESVLKSYSTKIEFDDKHGHITPPRSFDF